MRLAILVGVVLIMVVGGGCKGDAETQVPKSGREAMAAMQKLADSADSVKAIDYRARLNELKIVADRYFDSPESRNFPKFTADLHEALYQLEDLERTLYVIENPPRDGADMAILKKNATVKTVKAALQRASTQPGAQ